MKDFYEVGKSEDILKIRFKYFKENQEKILKAFEEFRVNKKENEDQREIYDEKYDDEYLFDEDFQVADKNQSRHIELEFKIKKGYNISQSTPSTKSSKAVSSLKNQNIGFLSGRTQKKISIDFDMKKQRQIERLRRIELEKELKMQNFLNKKQKDEALKKSPKKENTEKHQKKVFKIKEKMKEVEKEHENFIRSSLKKYSDIDQRIKDTVDIKYRQQSERVKLLEKNKLHKKQLLDHEKEQLRSENYLNKIMKIEESRKKIESKSISDLQARIAKSQTHQLKIQHKLMQEVQKLELKIDQYSPKARETKLTEEQAQKLIEKKELNRLMINTRISRNKLKLVNFIQTINRDQLFQRHIDKINKVNEFVQRKSKNPTSRKCSYSVIGSTASLRDF